MRSCISSAFSIVTGMKRGKKEARADKKMQNYIFMPHFPDIIYTVVTE